MDNDVRSGEGGMTLRHLEDDPTFSKVDIDIRQPVGASRVMVNGEDFPVTGLTINAEAGDLHPYVELRTARLNPEGTKLSGVLVEDEAYLEQLIEIARCAGRLIDSPGQSNWQPLVNAVDDWRDAK